MAEGDAGGALEVTAVETGIVAPGRGGFLSLAEGPDGSPVLTYGRQPTELVRATRRGGGWALEVISAQHGDRDNSLGIASDGTVRTYLEPGELPKLFRGFSVVHYEERLGPEHRHGDGPPERHALAEAVMRRGALVYASGDGVKSG